MLIEILYGCVFAFSLILQSLIIKLERVCSSSRFLSRMLVGRSPLNPALNLQAFFELTRFSHQARLKMPDALFGVVEKKAVAETVIRWYGVWGRNVLVITK